MQQRNDKSAKTRVRITNLRFCTFYKLFRKISVIFTGKYQPVYHFCRLYLVS